MTPIPKLQTIVINQTCNYVNKQSAIQKLTVVLKVYCLSIFHYPFCVRSVCQDMYITLCLRIRYPSVFEEACGIKVYIVENSVKATCSDIISQYSC